MVAVGRRCAPPFWRPPLNGDNVSPTKDHGLTEEMLARMTSLPLVFDGAVRPPATEAAIRAAESRCGLTLPDELRRMLRRFNGMTGPTDLDHGWLTLWGAEELELPSAAAGYADLTGLVVFADHGLSSWWYAIEAARSDGQESRVFMLARAPEVISDSLEAFLGAVVNGDSILYGRDG